MDFEKERVQEDPRILELRKMREKAYLGGGAERVAIQHAKGKLTARERLDLLLDPGTFNELEPFITHQGDEMGIATEKYMGDGVITGYGQINGHTVYIYAQDFTIYGGTLSEMQSHKICRVMDLALRNGVPIIGLIDSGGARIQEGVKSLGGYAEIFRRNAQYSGTSMDPFPDRRRVSTSVRTAFNATVVEPPRDTCYRFVRSTP
jgi:propionyl-CoA carboxylase beta chain